jgi:hypothetical protein
MSSVDPAVSFKLLHACLWNKAATLLDKVIYTVVPTDNDGRNLQQELEREAPGRLRGGGIDLVALQRIQLEALRKMDRQKAPGLIPDSRELPIATLSLGAFIVIDLRDVPGMPHFHGSHPLQQRVWVYRQEYIELLNLIVCDIAKFAHWPDANSALITGQPGIGACCSRIHVYD